MTAPNIRALAILVATLSTCFAIVSAAGGIPDAEVFVVVAVLALGIAVWAQYVIDERRRLP